MNSECRSYLETYNELIRALPAIRKEVTRLHESGAPKATDVGAALSGSLDQLLARSACTHREFRKAVAGKDGKFLEALRDRLVIWRAMLVESAEEKKGKSVARVMVGGSSYAAELPPDSEAAGLLAGAALLIAGEIRKAASKVRPAPPGAAEGQAPSKVRPALPGVAGGGWTFRVAAWGLRASIEAGEPMTLCKWPEGGAGAE